MLEEAKKLQDDAIGKIIDELKYKINITFKAPTGSGKTYMMASVMDAILANNPNVIFIVSSLSKGDLAEQNYIKFEEYNESKMFTNLKPYLISSDIDGESRLFIPTDYNVYVLPRDLYKKNSRLEQGALIDFLENITGRYGQRKSIYLIKDECHIATNNLDNLQKKYFSRIINCSATPKLDKKTSRPDVEIKEIDAVNAKLIKRVVYGSDDDTIEDAIKKYKELKKKYIEAAYDKSFGKMINPCLIIQISNKEKADDEIAQINEILNKNENQDLQWMLIVDKDKDCDTNTVLKKSPVHYWKESAKKHDSTIDIIIFKMVITEGWDIPRACMLYQVRDSKSQQLDEQVMGRVRRNPKLLDFEKLNKESQDLVTTSYIWGIKDVEEKDAHEVTLVDKGIQNELKVITTKLVKIDQYKAFDIEKFISERKKKVICDDIFDLQMKIKKSSEEVKTLGQKYITEISKWFDFANNIDDINKECKNIMCNYAENMEIVKDENGNNMEYSVPYTSYYIDNGNSKKISKWIWKRNDGGDEFSFDSEAEKEWCEILLDLISEDSNNKDDDNRKRIVKSMDTLATLDNISAKTYLIGKNYLPNSEIKYEYYLYGVHSSYPDFIMKDYNDNIHLFESKSLNENSYSSIDSEEYKEKINALKECYKFASQKTGYNFYIPVKQGNEWTIFKYFNGEETEMNKNEFIKSFNK